MFLMICTELQRTREREREREMRVSYINDLYRVKENKRKRERKREREMRVSYINDNLCFGSFLAHFISSLSALSGVL